MNGEKDPGNVNLREVSLVLVAGAIGGFLSWIYAQTFGEAMALVWYLAVPASMLFGTGAAFIGVYLLANVDTSALLRCLAFALLCGFLWMPVFDAGKALVFQEVRVKDAVEAGKAAAEAQSQVQALQEIAAQARTPGRVPQEVLQERTTAATDAAVKAMRAAEQVDNPTLRVDVARQAQVVLDGIQQLRSTNPRVGTEAEQLLRAETTKFESRTRLPLEKSPTRVPQRRPQR